MSFSSSDDSIRRRSINLGQANFRIQPTDAALRRDGLVICATALLRYLPEVLRLQLGHSRRWALVS